jgi:hypothetical protein
MKCVWRRLTRLARGTVSGMRDCPLFCFSLASNGRHPRQSIMKRLIWRDMGMKGDVPNCRFSTINRVAWQSIPPRTYTLRFPGNTFSRFLFCQLILKEHMRTYGVLGYYNVFDKMILQTFRKTVLPPILRRLNLFQVMDEENG